jgi:hypothetical protein
LEGVRPGHNALAVWAVIKPRHAVLVEPGDPALEQNCVTVDYLLAGTMPGAIGQASGLWTLEITDHALGRLVQRAPGVDIDATVLAAHHAVLNAKVSSVAHAFASEAGRFLVPAGPGVFWCRIFTGTEVSSGGLRRAHVHAHSWLHRDHLHDDQDAAAAALIADGSTADERLGQGILLPLPLRRLIRGPDHRIGVLSWGPGLPETLAATRGMA